MREPLQLIVRLTDDSDRVYATSPQAPGLVFGRESLAELRADLQDVLAFHFERSGPFEVTEHHERHYELAGGELVTRLAIDEHRDERQQVYDRLGRALRVPGQADALVSAVTNKAGEVVYVCALPTDTFGWLAAQLDGTGDALVAALNTADQYLLTLPIVAGEEAHPRWSIGPVSSQTLLSEIARELLIVAPPPVTHLQVV